MNSLFKNFKKLSAKQFKTYAAAIIFSALSFQAIAIDREEAVNPDPAIVVELDYQMEYEAQLELESWMIIPIETGFEEVKANEMSLPASFDASFETELALESWMTDLFEIRLSETYPVDYSVDNSMCSPAP